MYMKDVRCPFCNKKLAEVRSFQGEVNIKCERCKNIIKLNERPECQNKTWSSTTHQADKV